MPPLSIPPERPQLYKSIMPVQLVFDHHSLQLADISHSFKVSKAGLN
jgi:hypothetical protein